MKDKGVHEEQWHGRNDLDTQNEYCLLYDMGRGANFISFHCFAFQRFHCGVLCTTYFPQRADYLVIVCRLLFIPFAIHVLVLYSIPALSNSLSHSFSLKGTSEID